MLLSKEIEISVLNNNKKYLETKGYDVSGKKVIIKISDLPTGSKVKVLVQCDICYSIKENSYCNYIKSFNNLEIYTCSSKCSNIKKRSKNLEKFGSEWASQSSDIKDKIKYTNLERYGTANGITESKKEEIKKKNLEKWGVEHFPQTDDYKQKIKEKNLEKWGVDHHLKLDHIKEKIKKTNLEKWGVDNPLKSEEIRKKSAITKLEKYGDENYNNREKFRITSLEKWGKYFTQTELYSKKSKETNLEKYGVEHPMKYSPIVEKVKKTKLEKWGDSCYNNIQKIKETNYNKFGFYYTLQVPEIRNRMEETNIKKWGVKSILSLEHVIEQRKESFDRKNKIYVIGKYQEILPKGYKIIDYYNGELVVQHMDHQFITSLRLMYDRIKQSNFCEVCTICNPINSVSSYGEEEICSWLSEYFNIDRHNRTIMDGKEIDIYIPDKKLAIEFNGLYWHSELFKNKDYHVEKSRKCKELGISLIHIFEDDWKYRKEIVKSIIKNRLGLNEYSIMARNCRVQQVSLKDCKKFLSDNHIQGYSRCKYKLGLYQNGELVSVMTFGERRINSKREFELIRFCNKLNTNVVGGASKLFKFFINNYNYKGKIVSYADISLFDGALYEKIGFKFIHISRPNYFWIIGDRRFHRFKYNKNKLVTKFNMDPKKSGSSIMADLGHYKIWSCGQIRYEILI